MCIYVYIASFDKRSGKLQQRGKSARKDEDYTAIMEGIMKTLLCDGDGMDPRSL